MFTVENSLRAGETRFPCNVNFDMPLLTSELDLDHCRFSEDLELVA
jgi:hypothetical protein